MHGPDEKQVWISSYVSAQKRAPEDSAETYPLFSRRDADRSLAALQELYEEAKDSRSS